MAAKKKSAKKSRVKKATSKKKVARKKTIAKKAAKKKTAKKSPAKASKAPAKKAARKKTATLKKAVEKKSTAKKKSGKSTSGQVISAAVSKHKTIKKPITAVKPRTRAVTEVQPFKPYKPIRNEEYMNASQSEHFRTILLDWKKLLMEEVDRTVHHMQDEAANFPDPNDRATQEEEFALELRTRDRERKLIRKIDEAILGIETGDYGYCEVCGVEIGIKRLEARPTATLCIDCKTLDEIKEKQLG